MRSFPCRVVCLLTLAISGLLAPAAQGGPSQSETADHLAFARSRLLSTAQLVAPSAYPFRTTGQAWETRSASWWTSGFFPGSLWLAYRDTGDSSWRAEAERRQAGLEAQKANVSTHDVGFMILTSFGNGYRFTGNDAYRQVVLDAAASLATRFNPVVGCTRSWGSNSSRDFTVIADNMMNLELLFWAARNGGDPRWRAMAISHATRTMEEFVRPDGSTIHVVDFDPNTGTVRGKRTHQGLSVDSTWSRGQAWTLHGFAVAARETGDPRFLQTARRTADYFLDHLPSDGVPYWDFSATGASEPRDSSAASIAASGLVELSRVEVDSARKRRYLDSAGAILESLASPSYLSRGTSNPAILLHGTASKPHSSADTGLVFGDYYFIEALMRYRDATRPAGAAPVLPTPSPPARAKLRLGVPKRDRTLGVFLRRGLPVRVRASLPGRVAAGLSVSPTAAARLRLAARRRITVGRGRRTVPGARWTTVRVKASRTAKRRLKRTRRVRTLVRVKLIARGGPPVRARLPVTLHR